MRKLLLGVSVSLCGVGVAHAQTGICGNQPVDAVMAKYKPQYDQIQNDGAGIRNDATLSGKVDWKDQEFIFDTPTATMKTQTFVLGLPQVTMKDQKIIFDTPSIRMKRVKTGQYPEFHGFKIKWKNIYIDVPEPFMQRQTIVMGIPEFRWDNTTIKFDLPEFTMERQRIVVGLPQFTVTEAHLNANKIEEKSEALKDRATDLQQAQKLDLTSALHETFSCQRETLASTASSAMGQFDGNIEKLKAVIADLAAKGVDVTRVTDGNGGMVNLRAVLADLVAKRAAAAAGFADAASKLDEAEQKAVAQVV